MTKLRLAAATLALTLAVGPALALAQTAPATSAPAPAEGHKMTHKMHHHNQGAIDTTAEGKETKASKSKGKSTDNMADQLNQQELSKATKK
jgi:hypothetical protein